MTQRKRAREELNRSVVVRRAIFPQPPILIMCCLVPIVRTVVGGTFRQHFPERAEQPLRIIRCVFWHTVHPPRPGGT